MYYIIYHLYNQNITSSIIIKAQEASLVPITALIGREPSPQNLHGTDGPPSRKRVAGAQWRLLAAAIVSLRHLLATAKTTSPQTGWPICTMHILWEFKLPVPLLDTSTSSMRMNSADATLIRDA